MILWEGRDEGPHAAETHFLVLDPSAGHFGCLILGLELFEPRGDGSVDFSDEHVPQLEEEQITGMS